MVAVLLVFLSLAGVKDLPAAWDQGEEQGEQQTQESGWGEIQRVEEEARRRLEAQSSSRAPEQQAAQAEQGTGDDSRARRVTMEEIWKAEEVAEAEVERRRQLEAERKVQRRRQEAQERREAERKAQEAQHRRHEEAKRQAEAEARLAKEKQEAQRNAELAKKEGERQRAAERKAEEAKAEEAQHRRHEETQRQAEAEARLAKEKQEAQRNAALAKKEAEEEHRRQQEELARRNREEQREAERKVQEAKRQAEAEARLAKAEEAQHRRHEETQRQAEAEARLAKEKQEAQRNAALAKKEAEARLNKEKAALERKLALASKAAEAEAVEQKPQPVVKAVQNPVSAAQAPPETYRLRAGDELDISVWGHTDLNKKVQVAEDGSFEFPLIGPVHAAGHSLQEIQQEIQDRLNREYLVNPQVSIRPTNAKFSVLGEVSRPGSYLIEGAMDVLTAISLAGGITKFGSSRVDVIRGEEEEKVTIRTNVDAIIKGSEPNVDIMPHDTVYVRRRIF